MSFLSNRFIPFNFSCSCITLASNKIRKLIWKFIANYGNMVFVGISVGKLENLYGKVLFANLLSSTFRVDEYFEILNRREATKGTHWRCIIIWFLSVFFTRETGLKIMKNFEIVVVVGLWKLFFYESYLKKFRNKIHFWKCI